MRIYYIRHADPYYPDDSLTPAGHLEAQALARHLAQVGIDEIYCSPRGRARLTAQYTADRLHLPVMIEPWTNELDGLRSEPYHQTAWDVDGAILRSPEILAAAENLSLHAHPAPGIPVPPPMNNPRIAEHLNKIRAGSDDFLLRLGFERQGNCYRIHGAYGNGSTPAASKPKRIALFAHLGFGLTWLSHLLEIPLPLMWAGFYLHPSSVTTILFDERAPGFASPRLLGMGDITHLHQAGLSPSRAGLIANSD